jgi:hypothetical protein
MRYATRNSHCVLEECLITHLVVDFTAFMEPKVALPLAQNPRLDPVLDLSNLVHAFLTHLFEVLLTFKNRASYV